MYYNKKLYFPDTEYGGGKANGGAETGGDSDVGTEGNGPEGNGGGMGDGGNGGNGFNEEKEDFDDYRYAFTQTSTGDEPEVIEKQIKLLEVQNDSRFISAKGESRIIRVVGTAGAGFTITIKDSSGCSIMEEELENIEIPKGGTYTFAQEFPDIITSAGGGLIKEYYEVTITPHADVMLYDGIENGIPTYTLYQYPDPTITLATTSSQTSPALSVAVSGTATKRNQAGAFGDNIGESYSNWILTITEDSATNGNFYIKSTDFNGSIATDSVIKKIVKREVGEDPTSVTLNLKPLTTRAIGSTTADNVTKGDDNFVISGDLTVGMTIKGKVEKTKTVTNSLEVPSCKRKTDKFELNNTTDLFEKMFIYINGVLSAQVISIDCERNITISKKIAIRQNTDIVFRHDIGATVLEVVSQINSEGNACIKVDRYAYIPDNVELEFDDNDSKVSGKISFSGSGTDSVVLTNEIYVTKYGIRDTTYTLDLDNIITRKPNAKDFNVEVTKNGRGTIYLDNGDFDGNAASKVPTITQSSSNGTATAYDASDSGYTRPTIVYAPNTNFVGDDKVRYKLADDDKATDFSDEKTIKITVK